MSTEITTLPNGLRVVSNAMPHVETLSLGVWVAVGARHEEEREAGISHLLEHMAFKGTSTRSARQIAEEIESVGGELNAATSLEMTSYFARVLKGDEGVALEILADILQDSSFDEEELAREKEVVIQEIAAIRDSPDEIVYDLAQDAAFPGQAVGRPIIGTAESVSAISGEQLRTFMRQRYRPSDMIVSAAGAIRHDTFVRHVEALFGRLTDTAANDGNMARYSGGTRFDGKPFEQSHLVLGFESPSYRDADFFAAQVFSGLFGGGMSSRLFQEVRERRGLCYSIYSSAWGLKDTGMLGVHAATGADMMSELIDVVGVELKRIAETGATDGEVSRAKSQLKAGLLMALESSSARAEQMARHLLAHDRVIASAEIVAKVDAVTSADVRRFAERLVVGRPSVAVVGAGKRSKSFAARAERALTA